MKEGKQAHHTETTAEVITATTHKYWPLVIKGIGAGIVASIVTMTYRLFIDFFSTMREEALQACGQNMVLMLLWFVFLLVIATCVGMLMHYAPMAKGSGIPQVEGELVGLFHMDWVRTIQGKFIGGLMVIGCGLSMGREGPSVQLGALAGKGLSETLGLNRSEEKILMTAGAGAGLAAAFNAPLSGLLFALEEVHKNFSIDILLCTMAACVTSDYMSKYIFGLDPAISFFNVEKLPLELMWVPLTLGILLGILGAFYNWCSLRTQDLFGKLKGWGPTRKLFIPFLLSGLLAFTFPYVLGDGHHLMGWMIEEQPLIGLLFAVLVVKYIFSMICFGSGAPGGTLVPMLVLGSLIGGLTGTIAVQYFGLSPVFLQNFILLGMTGYFAAIVKAPITGIILTCEITGSFQQFLPYSIVALVAYVVSDLCHAEPLYELLLNRMIPHDDAHQHTHASYRNKVLVEIQVFHGCPGEGKLIREIEWPKDCLVVAILRDEREVIPSGDVRLYAGDTLQLLTSEPKVYFIKERLLRVFQVMEDRSQVL